MLDCRLLTPASDKLDPFLDETIEYIGRLAQTGVDVEFHLYPGCFHGFESIVPQAELK